MKIWTIEQPFEGRYLPLDEPEYEYYGGFGFRITATTSEGVEVVSGCEEAGRWLSSIRTGITAMYEKKKQEGELYRGIRIEITRIYSNEMTSEQCMKVGAYKLLWDLPRWLGSTLQCTEE
ncbi:MAG TPA: hypothetical protein VF600_05615 [Abditibacteriaceae bacterium]|jgi:hypothetical protein